jgi:hypothetical protein
MNLLLFLILVALFVVLTPGVVLSLPPKANKLTTALTHGVIFALVWTLVHKPLWRFSSRFEGMATVPAPSSTSASASADPNKKK